MHSIVTISRDFYRDVSPISMKAERR